jgi:hypothetical protein
MISGLKPVEFVFFYSLNALLICAAVVVDFCAIMSAANAQKGT